ncbi:DUF2256 domain-containing protein [Nocardioides flavescens]|uniref:DUF2256 domain-containing protein n=1 Tax=Nocardioides flavescens TaxID=2691959 RepID=A0A6L7F474_9ACTN|nr:DUF2256 domain-containing protein [Nocardioides flavescens]
MTPEPKVCASCGRRIEWRKKWERDWDDVRYCSTACRRRKVTPEDRALEDELRTQLASGAGRTGVDVGSDEAARRAARRLVAAGEGELVQRGRVVDPSTARGDVQLRRPR